MHEKQSIFDLQEPGGGFGDPRSWLSGDDHSSHSSVSNGNGSNIDPVLYKNLVEVLPLLESFMEGKSKPSYTRRASLVYTKTPTKESNPKKGREPKDKKVAQLIPAIKRKDVGDNKASKDESVGDFSIISSRASTVAKDREELVLVQEQAENLQQKLLEKDELLRSTETSMNQMKLVSAEIDELKRQVAEKESLIKSAHLQLSDVNVKLADKQATVEKLQKEMATCNLKIEELQDEMESLQGERAAFMLLFDSLMRSDCTASVEDYNTLSFDPDQLSCREKSRNNQTMVRGITQVPAHLFCQQKWLNNVSKVLVLIVMNTSKLAIGAKSNNSFWLEGVLSLRRRMTPIVKRCRKWRRHVRHIFQLLRLLKKIRMMNCWLLLHRQDFGFSLLSLDLKTLHPALRTPAAEYFMLKGPIVVPVL